MSRSDPTLVVGDVHGCLAELEALVREHGGGRRLALVGDLVAKGPDSIGVVRFAREQRAIAVLGNHDAHVLRVREMMLDGREPLPGKSDHRRVAEALSREDAAWLDHLPLWMSFGQVAPDAAELLMVHGGFVPGKPLDEQDRHLLMNLRSIKPGGAPSKRIEGEPWARVWPGPAHVVFGHDAVRGLQQERHATGLDTGCVYGGQLTGLLLPEWRLVSVPAKRVWAPKE